MAFDFNPTLMTRFQDQVALVDENRTGWFEGCLAGLNERMATIEKATTEIAASDEFWFAEDDWRAFLRPSGTEPVVRVTVEADDDTLVRNTLDTLAAAVRAAAQ